MTEAREMPDKFFIDIHCHLFNAEHVPLRQSIRRISNNFNKGLIKRGIIAAGAVVVAPLLILSSNTLAKKFYKVFEAFIRFFDQPAKDNIRDIIRAIRQVHGRADMDNRQRILTPLVMDFELCESYKRLVNQVHDLSKAISDKSTYLKKHNTRILPFLGMDLRRFYVESNNTPAKALQDFFTKVGVTFKPAAIRRDPTQLENGDFIGIKLYPSLGFDIYPQDARLRARNVAIFQRLKELQLPITTHCQVTSYECDPGNVSNETLINYANPHKWWQLLKQYPSLHDIRINFAHFGGEEGVAKALMWNDEIPDPEQLYLSPGGLFSSSWTYWIMRLLKQYPNTYSDISAFDFSDKKAVASLAWLIQRDSEGIYDALGTLRLKDKLMWGSDVPMILSDHGTYRQLFNAFYKMLAFKDYDSGNYGMPDRPTIAQDEIFNLLVETNPKRFLFE
jgi:predicted TIM-barrel fold metal-dependent hydrolase